MAVLVAIVAGDIVHVALSHLSCSPSSSNPAHLVACTTEVVQVEVAHDVLDILGSVCRVKVDANFTWS